ncbi:hypothetical protein GF362_01270 [Candidatus Dojkabacteria bacterium]|nr:hypothetical protein [Candidatus Dojkabacteria bacterium]
MYLGYSNEKESVGYLELDPFTSLTLHNRIGGIENLVQVDGKSVLTIFDKPEGTNHLLTDGEKFRIEPEGIWHIHSNPFAEKSVTYWFFDGDIRPVINKIREGEE